MHISWFMIACILPAADPAPKSLSASNPRGPEAGAHREALPNQGRWRAWLDTPGGELPFDMVLQRDAIGWQAVITNGEQVIHVPASVGNGAVTIPFDHYDATITAKLDPAGTRLDGAWKKRTAQGWSELPFHATAGYKPRFEVSSERMPVDCDRIKGRWSVAFSKADAPAVGQFDCRNHDGLVRGTFLTPTGDYGYLLGAFDGSRLQLSSFDGSHAFLFDARVQADGSLSGDFWSRDVWHETWLATRDGAAALPNAFEQTRATGPADLSRLRFRDVNGEMRSVSEFGGKAILLEVFGTWCPNCHDASEFLNELHARFEPKGLRVVGLAFELTGDFDRDARQVRRFAERHGTKYPVLLAGTSDKDAAAQALPMIDGLKAYPSFILLDAQGSVRMIYTGFSGPATGEAFQQLKRLFEQQVSNLFEF